MPRPIGELLPGVLGQTTERYQRLRHLQRRWAAIAGGEVSRHTKVVAFRRGVAYVQTDEPGAHYAVCLDKPRLLKRLNAGRDPAAAVHDIVIRVGDI